MKLKQLLQDLPDINVAGDDNVEIDCVQVDSRLEQQGACYIAIPGTKVDSNSFVSDVMNRGAHAIVSERVCPTEARELGVTWVQVADAHRAVGMIASAWNDCPSRHLRMIGVTGTNGKTTTTFLIHSLFKKVWQRAGLIGTIFCDDGKWKEESRQTTPGALDLQNMLGKMAENACSGVAMEVSSHALVQERVAGVEFDVGIFTNLTQDHLDFHKTMENYFQAKVALFEQMATQGGKKKPIALINIDDSYGRRLVEMFSSRLTIKTYGSSFGADFLMQIKHVSSRGSAYELTYKNKSYFVQIPLIGRFNIYNSLAALAGAVCAGMPIREAVAGMTNCPQVPGRLALAGNKESITAFVDYAHTPDALENVCSTLKGLCPRRLLVVFGCGGDRDYLKRPQMGAVVARIADVSIVTSDNPRSEDPEVIIKEIMQGMPSQGVIAVTDRAEAIMTAVQEARKGDVILIAGKGHERYQELANGERIAFNDMDQVRHALAELEEFNNTQFE
ncbi:MAG: UDP-N-acetylmuramoyl-L-alanyl-D-glutamate--2,6-diaminopimelate ligase [Akkermansia sp.]